MNINNKVAIVTGGIRGIGFVTAQHLLRYGAEYVAIFDLHEANSDVVNDALKKLEQEFTKLKFGYYHCDVVNVKEFIARYDDVTNLKENVDILINNAGICNENNSDLVIDVNFTSVVHCTIYAIERMGMHKLGKGGVVVNIGSIYGLINIPILPVYNATKHAVVSFVTSLKDHNEKLGMRIVCICPGMTRTNMTTSGNAQKILFDFISQKAIDDHAKIYLQDPNNVASAIIEILERGKGGDVWLVQNDKPAFNIGDIKEVEELKMPF